MKMEVQSYMAEYYAQNRAELSRKAKLRTEDLNSQIFSMLGYACVDCDESIKEFLTVDHVWSDRKGERSYSSHAGDPS